MRHISRTKSRLAEKQKPRSNRKRLVAAVAVLSIATFSLPTVAGDFTGVIDNDWFKGGNWSGASVPTSTDEAAISLGFDVAALIRDADGSNIDVNWLKVGDDSGGIVNSLTSEVDILFYAVSVGAVDSAGGHASGRMDLIGANLIGNDSSFVQVAVAGNLSGAAPSGEGTVTVTDGSILANNITVAYVHGEGADATGALTVTNGNITAVGFPGGIQIGNVSPGVSGEATGSVRLENGVLSGFAHLAIGNGYSSVANGSLTLINSAAMLAPDGFVFLSDGHTAASNGVLNLQSSFLRADSATIFAPAVINLTVDGLSRAEEGNVGAGTYSSIDLTTASVFGGVVNVDFASYLPASGDTFDLVTLGAGEAFYGEFFDAVNVLNLALSFNTEIIPATAASGEILRLTVLGDLDGDGTNDDLDNCIEIFNPAQRDSNGDGFGNVCDADLNNDGIVNFPDLMIMKAGFFGMDPDLDLNGDLSVNFADLELMKAGFFGSPGPSGIAP